MPDACCLCLRSADLPNPLSLLQSSSVFGTLGPAVVPATMGQDLQCLSGKYEKDCATACASTSGCSGFLYTAQGSSSGGLGRGVLKLKQLLQSREQLQAHLPCCRPESLHFSISCLQDPAA